MLEKLDRRDDGYELFEITDMDDLDFAAFIPMADASWKHDYTDQARLDFDEAVIRKMAAGSFWVAVLACTADGSPVGFELALERRLRVRGRSVTAACPIANLFGSCRDFHFSQFMS